MPTLRHLSVAGSTIRMQDSGKVPVVPGADDEFNGRKPGDRPSLRQCIQVFARRLLPTGDVDRDIAVQQIRHCGYLDDSDFARDTSAAQVAQEVVDVFDAVAEVGTVLPYAIERKITNRRGFGLQAVGE
jgi:transcription elongation factor